MAQAPGGGGFPQPQPSAEAPRTNKTIKQFGGMQTQNERNAIPEGQFRWLENIQPIGPANLHSIPGRGPGLTVVPPVPVPPVCTDATLRGQVHIEEQLTFINPDDHGGNTHTSWSFISSAGELYTLAGAAGCGGGNMTYGDACCQLNHFTAPGNPADHPALVDPDGFPAVNAMVGKSDEPAYSFANSAYRRVFFPASNTAVNLTSPTPPGPPFGNFTNFIKRGTRFYGTDCTFGGGDTTPHRLWAWDLPSGNPVWQSLAQIDYQVNDGSATDDFLYLLVSRIGSPPSSPPPTPIYGILKIDSSDGSLSDTFDLDNISAVAMFAVNDNLIYVFNGFGGYYYIENFTDLIFVGRTLTTVSGFSNAGFFTNGRFYHGGNGFSGGSPDVFSFDVPCPEGDPIIAGVTTDASVVAGANLTVNWTDVLEPTTLDKLYLNANDGTRFNPAPVAQATPGSGAGTDTYEFPVPGGTTPGSYVIQYVNSAACLVATSAPFTVT